MEEITRLPDPLSGCLAEVEGILIYSAPMDRFALRAPDGTGSTITVFFFRGRRTHFSETPSNGHPRFYDQVAALVGERVLVVGTAVSGQVDVDVGHVVVMDHDA